MRPTTRTVPSRRVVVPRPGQSASIFEGVLIGSLALLAWPLSDAYVSPYWSLFSVLLFLWAVTFVFRAEPRATILAIPDLIVRSAVLLALVGIEFGNNIPELGTVGTPGAHATSYLLYTLFMFAGYVVAFRHLAGRPGTGPTSPLAPLFDRYANLIGATVLAVVGMILLWLILKGLVTGFPLLNNFDRFAYRRLHGDKITLYALNNKLAIEFVLGIVAFRLPAIPLLKLSAIAAAVAFLMVTFLFGDKMTTQLIALSGFIAPFVCAYPEKLRRHLVAFLSVGLLALIAAFSVTWFVYSAGGRDTAAATIERLSGRLVGTGELWYLQTRLGAPLVNWDGDIIGRNIEALKIKNVEPFAVANSLGPNYYSNRYAPDDIRNSIARQGGTVTFTAAYEPLLLATFGWVGLGIAMIITGIISALVAAYMMFAINSRSIVSAVFASFVAVLWRAAASQGTPWTIVGLFALKWLAVIFVIEIAMILLGLALKPRGASRRERFSWRANEPHLLKTSQLRSSLSRNGRNGDAAGSGGSGTAS